ncbi:MAG: recombinase family protein [Elusimicrobiota bacterium]
MEKKKTLQEKKVAIYTRTSKAEPGLDVPSNKVQRASCHYKNLSMKEELWKELETLYDDEDFSGKNLKRPAIQKLLQDIREGKIDIVIIYKLDRLTRSTRDFQDLLELFEKHNITLVSSTEPIDTKTLAGRLLVDIMIRFAQYDRELDVERAKDSRYFRVKIGLWGGGMPSLGYILKNKRLEIVHDEKKIVKKAFQLYLEIKSCHLVAKELSRFYRTKTYRKNKKLRGGRQFKKKDIARILNNKLYIGIFEIENPKTKQIEQFKGVHKPIIDIETFNQVQEIMKRNRKKKKSISQNKYDMLLTGLLKCGYCGSAMTMYARPKTRKDGTTRIYFYYKCRSVVEGDRTECKLRSVPAEELEKYVIERLIELGSNKKVLNKLIELVNIEAGESSKPLKKKKSALLKQLQNINSEIRGVINFLKTHPEIGERKDNSITKEYLEYEVRKKEIEEEILQIDVEIASKGKTEVDTDAVGRILRDFSKTFYALERKDQVQLMHTLVKEIIYRPKLADRIKITLWNWPGSETLQKLLDRAKNGNLPIFRGTGGEVSTSGMRGTRNGDDGI